MSSSTMAYVRADRGQARMSLSDRSVSSSLQHFPIAQQRRFSSGRRASLPCLQHWQVRASLFIQSCPSRTLKFSSFSPKDGSMCTLTHVS
ncbi:hypothetical protein [Lentzea sp. HUAS12]|uniref:hypothetical protein n=1 Tax=Lentzea sp. HUAS12 TaxID=2951806 RepID=UPI00209D123F|nr:hypothetical protein [Lentzea sp. HUAS12]USX52301.1 hypothetical protein ND450_44465 [Lentzea sp. HUAS12]